jgi:hypothetical protein
MIASRHTPADVLVQYCRQENGGGLSWIDGRKQIEVPRPTSPETLRTFLHEVAHVHLGHRAENKLIKPRHVEELEAELWSFRILRAEGLPVTCGMVDRALQNVRDRVEEDRAAGHSIDPAAIEFTR